MFDPMRWLSVCIIAGIMASSSTSIDSVSSSSSVPAPVKVPMVTLLIAVVAGALIAAVGCGGILYCLARSGRLPMQGAAPAKAMPAGPVPTHAMVLEPLLVNLADEGGSAYLRVSLTLRVVDPGAKELSSKEDKGAGDAVAAVRDTALGVLGRQTADGLLAVDGKERLKAELKAALAKHNSDLKVTELFFTEFLVQR